MVSFYKVIFKHIAVIFNDSFLKRKKKEFKNIYQELLTKVFPVLKEKLKQANHFLKFFSKVIVGVGLSPTVRLWDLVL